MLEKPIKIDTHHQKKLIDITDEIKMVIKESNLDSGICNIYCPHTTAAITINEGADPDVIDDIITGLEAMVPELDYKHYEGNSRSHIMASLIGASEQILITDRQLMLGRWQRIYFCEFDGPRSRNIICRIN